MTCHVFPKCSCIGFCKFGPTRNGLQPVSLTQGWTARILNGKRCAYCNEVMDVNNPARLPTRDHIVPRSQGGINGASNYVGACRSCNEDKAAKRLDAWARELLATGDRRAAIVARFVEKTVERST